MKYCKKYKKTHHYLPIFGMNMNFVFNHDDFNYLCKQYQDYEADIMFLKKEGFSTSRIAQFLEDTYNLKNDKSLTALQSFIKVREKKINKVIEKKVENIEQLDNKIENTKNDMTSTEEDLLNLVGGFIKK